MLCRPLLRLFLVLSLAPWMAWGQARTQVRLLLDQTAATPGQTLTAGIELTMPPGWHTYWRNPSEVGGPGTATKIVWTLPAGVTAGDIQWPVPTKQTDQAGDTHVFNSSVMLLVPLTVSADAKPGPQELKARVSWLECETECIPGKTSVSATLTIGGQSQPSGDSGKINGARALLPASSPAQHVSAAWEGEATGDQRALLIEWQTDAKTGDFFAYESKGTEIASKTEVLPPAPGKLRLRKTVNKTDAGWPMKLAGLVVANPASPDRQGYEIAIPISDGVMAAAAVAKVEPFSLVSLLPMLGFAFIGGLILNIMPCVLPVLALKILGFVRQSGNDPRQVRHLGLMYGAGVLTSFLVLAGVALAVQAAGGVAGWSTAFQNPQFRVIMCVLLVLVALNLFGVFEVNLGGGAMGAAGDLATKEGASGAFFNGVLAAVLATPCTAPFLATAVTFAFTQPPPVLLAIFLTVGLGLAAPFVVLCWHPAWLKLLPKPGAWMLRFKVAMGFPMLGTAIWIFWFTANRLGQSGVLWLGLFLVVVSAAAWVWGEFAQRSDHRPAAIGIALVLAAAGYFGILEGQLDWRTPQSQKKPKLDWQVWNSAAVAQARMGGHPVLVDFTADNCANCKFNKATSIEIHSTIAKIEDHKVVTLAGDFTDADPAIAAELQKYGRRGVPLVLVYSKDPSKPPRALPTVLTPSIVQEALDWAAQ
ncbi:MAG TPA: protein-disulfide reductase DsbD domain-containing protein [Candidatus Limnocylindria bacterium]|nr:protein-disulfide reductase DsbD domain-containing protein [Candidatus Limnocylindria bacterium]